MDAQRLVLRRVVACTAPKTAASSGLLSSRLSALLLSSSSTSSSSTQAPAGRRYQSTARRTKKALNIAPHPTFLGNAAAAQATATAASAQNAKILFNPPASAPSVYQTPFKFLPKSDPRRRSNITSLFRARPAASTSSTTTLPPSVLPAREKRYHLSEDDVKEMRALRVKDPIEWSVLKLARRFECSPIFVMLAVRTKPEHHKYIKAKVESARQKWGPIRTKAREDRVKRREMLYNGEL